MEDTMITTVSADHPGRRLTDATIKKNMAEIARNRTSRQLVEHGLYQAYRTILVERQAAAAMHPQEERSAS